MFFNSLKKITDLLIKRLKNILYILKLSIDRYKLLQKEIMLRQIDNNCSNNILSDNINNNSHKIKL